MNPAIYPSLISASLLNLQQVITTLDPHCDGYHVDIMDGQFVPNITWGPAFANAIAATTNKTIWVHLMTTDPFTWIDRLELPKNSIVSFHIEANDNTPITIKAIREKGWRASITVSPKTNIVEIVPLLDQVDQVLVMSVDPGFSGQQFLTHTLEKIPLLVAEREKQNLTFSIGMDGGIGKENCAEIVRSGVQDLAIAHAIFGQKDPVQALTELRALLG